ncbi:dehydrogenase of unknown specificity, short-chain alcohol dehydrogenase like protein [Pseudomonas sp. GM84]|nr:dehydrogenase of unknown specificity, short-chain alcohol dehydrogenase like protein [Pseudomonas sp. GM84]
MDLQIKNKIALVLGGGGGLGGAIALSLAKEGVKVAVADISIDAAEKTVNLLKEHGAQAYAIQWDLARLEDIETKIATIEAELGPVDILVNNTGGPPPTTAHSQDAGVWSTHFQSMVVSVIKITDRVLPGMRERKWGRVITSTSSGVVSPIPNLGISNALRLSLVGWSKTLAKEVGNDGVTVNIVLPGRIATGRITFLDEAKAKREGRSVEEVSKESTAAIAVGRYGDPKEYGDVVAFLASGLAGYLTGSTVRIDGGLISSLRERRDYYAIIVHRANGATEAFADRNAVCHVIEDGYTQYLAGRAGCASRSERSKGCRHSLHTSFYSYQSGSDSWWEHQDCNRRDASRKHCRL